MVHEVSRTIGAALHHQVQSVIRNGIFNGDYADGARLPPEVDLCDLYAVSRITIRRALQSLEQEGLIKRERGRGTFVCAPRRFRRENEGSGFLRRLSDVIQTTVPRVLEFGLVRSPAEVCELLNLPAGGEALRVVRVRSRGPLPVLHATTYLPPGLASRTSEVEFGREAASSILLRCGYVHRRVSYVTGAALADATLAMLLSVPIGSALLELRRLAFGDDDAPFEYLRVLAPPDRYRFEVTMSQSDAHSGLQIDPSS